MVPGGTQVSSFDRALLLDADALLFQPPEVLPAPSGANKKSFPRGVPMQHLVLCRNPERNPERLTALDWVLYLTFSENMTRVLAHPHLLFAHGI